MKMVKRIVAARSKLKLILILVTLSLVSSPHADEFDRGGKGEVYGIIQQLNGDSVTGSAFGISTELELDDTISGGIGFGYNFNNHINLNTDTLFGVTDVNGKARGVMVEGDTFMWGWNLNLDINVLPTRVTPVITGGVGFIHFNGDFEGFTFQETDFSYNLGVGIRWDVTDHFLVKGMYRGFWTELQDTDDQILLDGVNLSVGFAF